MSRVENPELWELVPLTEFKAPSGTTTEVVRLGIHGLWKRLAFWNKVKERPKLETAGDELLEGLAPALDWASAARALKPRIEERFEEERLLALVGGPFSGLREMLAALVEQPGFQAVVPPNFHEILDGGGEWLDGLVEVERKGPAVEVLHLDECFVRHHNGLDLIHRLVDALNWGEEKWLLHCNSWAWSYLDKVGQLSSMLPPALTLSPFDRSRMETWLHLTCQQSDVERAVVLQDADAEPVFYHPPPEESSEEAPETTSFLDSLVGRARGEPRLVHDLWSHCLGERGDEEGEPEKLAGWRDYRKYWVTRWRDVQLPSLPANVSRQELFILQALLLHHRLTGRQLAELLLMAESEVRNLLQRLRTGGFTTLSDEGWEVNSLGYPSVRQHLKNDGFLID